STSINTQCILAQRVYIRTFYFFRAEDGIRDRNVTGVQTCALPISYGHSAAASSMARAFSATALFSVVVLPFVPPAVMSARTNGRSEERRVGKECRYLW